MRCVLVPFAEGDLGFLNVLSFWALALVMNIWEERSE